MSRVRTPLVRPAVEVTWFNKNFNSRLGIKKIFLLDNDVVEVTNLNRQLLFSQDDVGRRKVDAAMDGLKHHVIDTGK